MAGLCVLLQCFYGCASEPPVREIDLADAVAEPVRTISSSADGEIVLGFDRRLEIKDDLRMYVSLVDYLERETGYEFRVHVTPPETRLVDELGRGDVDIAAMGTLGYLQASALYDARIMARGLNDKGEDSYRAAIVVKPESDIQGIGDLRGRSFAFGSSDSTQGNLIPLAMLLDGGVKLSELGFYQNFSSHSEVASIVIRGDFEAGSIQDTLASHLESMGLLRIVAFSGDFPSSGFVASSCLDPERARVITEALLEFDPAGADAEGLYHWEMSEMQGGFVSAEEEDYVSLREKALQLGLLVGVEADRR